MKKTAVIFLAGVLALSMLAGCGKKKEPEYAETDTIEAVSVVESEPEPEPAETHIGEARSDLTGEWIDEELAGKRPLAVMLGNTKVATPQYGISQADVIYEAPVEGGETRLMGIFQDYANVEKIMSIRSCRRYYIDWALEFDAIYAHYGQASYALSTLERSDVHNLSGLDGGVESRMYQRDSSRKAPHNAYTTGDGILAGIDYKGYPTEHSEDYENHYHFNEDDENEIQLSEGQDAVVVKPGYLVNKPWFVYDSTTGLYSRYQNGAEQIDGNNSEQVQVKNILIQVCGWTLLDNDPGYLEVYTTDGGSGYYITNGKAIPVTWSKESQNAPTRYFDEAGNEITLNQGKTWVCITQDTYEDKIALFASEEEFEAAY